MRLVHKVKRLFSNLSRRHEREEILDRELLAYVEELTERNLAMGMSRAEARRQALVELGGIEQVKEQVRDEWLGQEIETTLQDIRYAYRSLLRSPGFMVVVIATLALGIGANVTMFGLMRAVLWRPLPYPEPDRIVVIHVDAKNVPNTGATLGEVLDLKERSRSFEQVSMLQIDSIDDLEYQGETDHVQAASVSDNFLPLLGARPVLGRTLDSRIDEGNGHVLSIVISDKLWRSRFSADPKIIGKRVLVNNLDVRIVGVLGPGFRLFLPPDVSATEEVDVWFPSALSPTRQYRGIPVVARLRPGVTLGQANAELQTLAAQFEREYPDFYSGAKGWQASPADSGPGGKLHLTARPLHEEITREARPALFLLAGAVGFVLLIACVNAANLMLARGSARQRELEIRWVLGAGRIRIMRQLLTESLLLALGAAAIGLLCAQFGLEALRRLHGSHIPLESTIGMDPAVALFAVVLSVVTGVLFGLLPAWRMASGKTGSALRAGRTETAASGARRLQRMLVAAEVAMSIVLLACGGLMLRSFLNLLDTPLGFNPTDVVTARVPLNLRRYSEVEQRWTLLRDIIDHVGSLPGVKRVSAGSPLPLAGDQQTRRVGRADRPDDPPILATQQGAIPGYLGVIGTPLLAGRDFMDTDIGRGHKVTIIDERLAKRLWPEGAIGKRLAVYRTGWRDEAEVVGVTSPVRVTRVRDENIPHFMLPDEYPGSLVIKTHETAVQISPGIQLAVKAAHTGRAAFDIRPMSDYVANSIGDTRFMLLVLTAFAGVSVLLAAAGLYGTLAYLTAQRTREFGIRLALGSSVSAIVAIVMRESVLLSAAGLILGLAGVAAASGAIRKLLYGVKPLDSVTLLGVAGVVGVVALVAASAPAWRAARTDPQASLRSE
jgi:predicted permease